VLEDYGNEVAKIESNTFKRITIILAFQFPEINYQATIFVNYSMASQNVEYNRCIDPSHLNCA